MPAALDKSYQFLHEVRMLHRWLNRCLIAIVATMLAGAAVACPIHEAEQLPSSGARAQAVAVEVAALVRPDSPDRPAASAVHGGGHVASRHGGQFSAGSRATPSGATSTFSSEPIQNGCCGTGACHSVGTCAGHCCAGNPALLGAGSPQERKLVVYAPTRPSGSSWALARRAPPDDGVQHRQQWRAAEGVLRSLREPRLARVARLTI